MGESFELPVNYNGDEIIFASRVYRYGYSHRIDVNVHGNEIIFEPDEERNYRAVASPEQYEKIAKDVDPELLKAIVESIQSLVG